jgi:hypothetical protein
MTKRKKERLLAQWLVDTVDSVTPDEIAAFRDWACCGARDADEVLEAVKRGWVLVLDREKGAPRFH